ncbi:hypothetical protein [Chromobacterium rhizoryzae]|uniref:Uncharacterized protein n=1 Tax=Chromobacterium rhizoryzae TaxID=1778675 RepID=A0AAD0RPM4_9NEIS|nr:hypothetical protein [Chromobacterium rhizoryzae]AXT46397.1 hypothetical protein D1345_09445 [Chromobacterium rhizoryzae]
MLSRNNVIRLAREAGMQFGTRALPNLILTGTVSLEKYAALVAAAEREECVQTALSILENPYADRVRWVAKQIASDIRARGKKGF